MKESEEIYLRHIFDAIKNIERYTRNIDYNQFEKNSMVYHAVIYQILVIGEAVKNLSEELKDEHPSILGEISQVQETASFTDTLRFN
jgi:uncharacterized protein with HEPN domain